MDRESRAVKFAGYRIIVISYQGKEKCGQKCPLPFKVVLHGTKNNEIIIEIAFRQ